MQSELENRIELLIQAFDTSDDRIKLRILQEIAKSSNCNHLKTILPFSKYGNKLTTIAAANTARQILSRMRVGKLSIGSLPQETIKEIVLKLNSNYESWCEDELESSPFLQKIMQSLNGKKEHELIDLCFGKAGMVLALPVKDSTGAVVVKGETELGNAHLIRIKATGVKQITIKKRPDETGNNSPDDTAAAVEEDDPVALQLNSRFADHEHDETMMKIKTAIHEFLSSRAVTENKQVNQA